MNRIQTTAIGVLITLGVAITGTMAQEQSAGPPKKPQPAAEGNLKKANFRAAAAADFTLTDSTGQKHTLSQYKDKIVVLEWTNQNCPYVQRHAIARTSANLATEFASKGVVWLAVDSSKSATADKIEAWRTESKLPFPVLLDPNGAVGRQYHAKTTPHVMVVRHGKVVYNGAIDNDPHGRQAKGVNYVSQALQEILAGKPVSKPETTPYGCSVKYADAAGTGSE